MRRRGKKRGVIQPGKSKLVLALETGKSIKGLKGFVNIAKNNNDEMLFVPVVVEGLKASDDGDEDYCECGDLKVAGVIQGSKSKLYFDVADWADSTADVRANTAKKLAIRKAEKELQEITNHHYLARQRLALEIYTNDTMGQGMLKDFILNMQENNQSYKTLDKGGVRHYGRIAVCVVNGIKPDEASYDLKER